MIDEVPIHMMVLGEDQNCSLENSLRIYNELKTNDKNNMHSFELIEDVDHLYFTWVTKEQFVNDLATIIEKHASNLYTIGGAMTASLTAVLI